jgi:hypothetical protein
MKRNLSLIFLFVFAMVATVFAQSNKVTSNHPQMRNLVAKPAVKKAYTGFENIQFGHEQSIPGAENSLLDIVGNTTYDLQSNGGVGRRVQVQGNGEVGAVFTFATGTTWPDRGTGYNVTSGGVWGAPPSARIETSRTGFTNYLLGPDGTEYTFSHGQAPFRTVMSKRVPGGSWVDSNVPNATPSGTLWARAAIGGSNGQTIHVIATTTPTGNGGVAYQGMNGVVLYYRSQDGGATWDIIDQLLPGIDSTTVTGTDVEGYAIDANGDNVSIFVTNTFNDSWVFISENNGDTWTTRIVNDFPLDRYVVNTGYDPAILPVDPNAPVPEAIFAADGAADVLVDASGITHCFYGSTYVNDVDTTDAGWTFYPGSNVGIVYWNSTMDDNAGVSAGYCPDINGNDTLDVTDISNYGYGLNTHPSAAIDQDGNLYLTYVTVHELYVDVNAGMNFRKPYIVASTDLGATWNLPKPILDDELLGQDSTEAPYLEAIFTSTAKVANDKVHCTFQADYAVFNFVNDATNEVPDGDATDNSIRYVGYPVPWALVNTKNVTPEALKFEIMPNPASDQVLVQYSSDRAQAANVEVYDMYGQLVRKTTRANIGVGTNAAQINTADLANGMYFVRLNLGNSFATRKLTVQH